MSECINKVFKQGDILYSPTYVKILKCVNDEEYFVEDIFFEVQYTLEGHTLINTYSGCTYYETFTKISLSCLIEKFLDTKDGSIFTVCFKKLNNEFRYLRGKYIGQDLLYGRSRVFDLDIKEIRLVDHRTLQFLIVDEHLYIVNDCELSLHDINTNLLRF